MGGIGLSVPNVGRRRKVMNDVAEANQFVVLMRHGERRDSILGAPSEADPPLTERGKLAIAETAGRIRSEMFVGGGGKGVTVVTSPFLRAMETAEGLCRANISSNSDAAIDNSLCEVFGPLRIRGCSGPPNVSRPNACGGELPKWGEGIQQATDRFVGSFLRNADSRRSDNLILVSHGDAISAVLSHFYPKRVVYNTNFLSYIVLKRTISSQTDQKFVLHASSGVEWILDGEEADEPIYTTSDVCGDAIVPERTTDRCFDADVLAHVTQEIPSAEVQVDDVRYAQQLSDAQAATLLAAQERDAAHAALREATDASARRIEQLELHANSLQEQLDALKHQADEHQRDTDGNVSVERLENALKRSKDDVRRAKKIGREREASLYVVLDEAMNRMNIMALATSELLDIAGEFVRDTSALCDFYKDENSVLLDDFDSLADRLGGVLEELYAAKNERRSSRESSPAAAGTDTEALVNELATLNEEVQNRSEELNEALSELEAMREELAGTIDKLDESIALNAQLRQQVEAAVARAAAAEAALVDLEASVERAIRERESIQTDFVELAQYADALDHTQRSLALHQQHERDAAKEARQRLEFEDALSSSQSAEANDSADSTEEEDSDRTKAPGGVNSTKHRQVDDVVVVESGATQSAPFSPPPPVYCVSEAEYIAVVRFIHELQQDFSDDTQLLVDDAFDLRRQLDRLRRENEQLKDSLSDLERHQSDLWAKVRSTADEKFTLERERESDRHRLTDKIQTLEDALETQRQLCGGQLDAMTALHKAQLLEAQQSHDDRCASLSSQLEALDGEKQSTVRSLTSHRDTLVRDLQELQQEVTETKRALTSSIDENGLLTSQIMQLSQKLQALTNVASSTEKENTQRHKDLTEELDSARSKTHRLTAVIVHTHELLDKLLDERDRLSDELVLLTLGRLFVKGMSMATSSHSTSETTCWDGVTLTMEQEVTMLTTVDLEMSR
uniref:Histidine phosphatase n=1 Tax=Bodo saltans TaxID=75058 RepID=B6DTI8_BODSA|nr:hypothetical protein [Bodo saltans]